MIRVGPLEALCRNGTRIIGCLGINQTIARGFQKVESMGFGWTDKNHKRREINEAMKKAVRWWRDWLAESEEKRRHG
jgi:hypothetical protein